MMSGEQHHRYSASGSAGWLTCAGKLAMEKGFSDTSSPAADEGSAAHFLASECLLSNLGTKEYLKAALYQEIVCWEMSGDRDGQSFVGSPLPEGAVVRSTWKVGEEMIEHVRDYCNYVNDQVKGGELLVEKRVHFGTAIGVPGAFGTSDASILNVKKREIVVIDLKYGFGEVSADHNTQMMLYALGILEEFELDLDLSGIDKVRMVIYQPRLKVAPQCPEWTCTIAELYAFGDVAKAAVVKAERALEQWAKPQPKDRDVWEAEFLQPSEKGCQWCKVKRGCRALAKETFTAMLAPATDDGLMNLDDLLDERGSEFVESLEAAILDVRQLQFEQIERIYAVRGMFKAWMDAIEDRMLTDMLEGQKSRNWKLVKGRQGNRAWADEVSTEEFMKKGLRLKQDEMYQKKIISPTEAEKLLAKKRPVVWKKLEGLISRSEGKPTLAPMTDKRPSINPHDDDLAFLPELSNFCIDDLLD